MGRPLGLINLLICCLPRRSWLGHLLVATAIVAALGTVSARAQTSEIPMPTPMVRPIWLLGNPVDKLVVGFGEVLNKKQKTLIKSGFSTFSQLIVSHVNQGMARELFRVACTVKMDAWDEVYELARLDERPQAVTVNDFGDYVKTCLTAEVVDQPVLELLAPGTGSLHAEVQIEQISPAQANRIKEWLIRQQSGVMQGLFSHMLNEITLSETMQIDVPVSPKPAGDAESSNGTKSLNGGQGK